MTPWMKNIIILELGFVCGATLMLLKPTMFVAFIVGIVCALVMMWLDKIFGFNAKVKFIKTDPRPSQPGIYISESGYLWSVCEKDGSLWAYSHEAKIWNQVSRLPIEGWHKIVQLTE